MVLDDSRRKTVWWAMVQAAMVSCVIQNARGRELHNSDETAVKQVYPT